MSGRRHTSRFWIYRDSMGCKKIRCSGISQILASEQQRSIRKWVLTTPKQIPFPWLKIPCFIPPNWLLYFTVQALRTFKRVWTCLGDGVRRTEHNEERYRQVQDWEQKIPDRRIDRNRTEPRTKKLWQIGRWC